MGFDKSHIQQDILNHPYWCLWKYERRDGQEKPTKVLYNPRTGGRGQSNNPSTFAPFEVAYSRHQRGGFDGLGVGVFDGLCAVDIDHCVEGGKPNDMAQDVISTLGSCTELSPSKTGIRIFFRAQHYQHDKKRFYTNNQAAGLEIYISGATNKFLTVTGNVIEDKPVRDCSDVLPAIMERYMQRKPKAASQPAQMEITAAPALSDNDVLQIAATASNRAKFNALWNGDISGYKSASEADIALCNLLAFYTGRDAAQMDRLFRQSGLYREKWDRRQNGVTYGAETIAGAIRDCTSVYSPHPRPLSASTRSKIAEMRPEMNERYPHSELGAGYLFADYFKDNARFVPERKCWYVYSGKVWAKDEQGVKVRELAKRLARELKKYAAAIKDETASANYLKFALRWQSYGYRETVLREAQSVYSVSFKEFDADPYLFNCKNGTLNLKTGEFLAHTPDHYQSKIANVIYDPLARSERWVRFIDEVMSGDAEKARFLQKALGYALTGDTSKECLFILYGPTSRNGKGTTMETFLHLLGDYGRTANPDSITAKQRANGSGPTEDIARLAGARFVNISEPDKNMILSAALIKQLTGNDTITARYLNENSFEFQMVAKLFLNGNYLPSITDTTVFDSDRVHVIMFDRHFSEAERDTGLKSELRRAENISGILNWCIEGWKALQSEGFVLPQSVIAATAAYREDSDKIGRFIDDELIADINGEVKLSVAYSCYESWCRENGYRAENSRNFSNAIRRQMSIERKRPRGTSAEPANHIIGYALREPLPWVNDRGYASNY